MGVGMARAGALAMVAALCGPAEAQLFWNPPDFRGPPVTGDEPGLGQPLPKATPKELDAHLLWNMRAGLNVAALQCQFSPTLMTVSTYNALLAHHGKEFQAAYKTLEAYFQRSAGKGRTGQTAFDSYTTKTYNGFSTLYAQLGFCHTAASIGQEALLKPKGQLLGLARARLREFRNSLTPAFDRNMFLMVGVPAYPLPRLDEACYTKQDLLKISCGNWRPASLVAEAPAGVAAPSAAQVAARVAN